MSRCFSKSKFWVFFDFSATSSLASGNFDWSSSICLSRPKVSFSKLDNFFNIELQNFSEKLEKVCISTIESGAMTKDLALLVGNNQGWMETIEFLEELEKNLKAEIS